MSVQTLEQINKLAAAVLRLHVGDDFPRMQIERRQDGQGTKRTYA
jgi:hypothetical protein